MIAAAESYAPVAPVTLAIAFLAGVVSCLSPCVLPVIPVFLAQVRGISPTGFGATVAAPSVSYARAFGFLLGFAGVFVLLWVSLGLAGAAVIRTVPAIRPAAGVAIAMFGLAMLMGWQIRLPGAGWRSSHPLAGSTLLGAGVAIGWTPCIGPSLAVILSFVAASESIGTGTLLLLAYALGMSLPFVALALGIDRVKPIANGIARHHVGIRVASGATMIGVGYLVATNEFARLAGVVPWII